MNVCWPFFPSFLQASPEFSALRHIPHIAQAWLPCAPKSCPTTNYTHIHTRERTSSFSSGLLSLLMVYSLSSFSFTYYSTAIRALNSPLNIPTSPPMCQTSGISPTLRPSKSRCPPKPHAHRLPREACLATLPPAMCEHQAVPDPGQVTGCLVLELFRDKAYLSRQIIN